MKHIKNKFGDIVYCIRDDGTITDKFDCDIIGHLKEDRITDKYDIDTLFRIRNDGTITDKFDCDIIGHIREDGHITDKYDIDTLGRVNDYSSYSQNRSTTNYSSSNEDGGFFSFLLSLLLSLIISILKFIFVKVIPCYFIYFWLPSTLMITWFGIILLVVCMIFGYVGLVPLIILVVIPLAIIQYLFVPYYIFVVVVKIKTKCSTKEIFKLFWRWFLKGPFAYPEVVNIMTENNILPKVTKIANKIIDFFKKIANKIIDFFKKIANKIIGFFKKKFPKKEKNKHEE